MAAEGGGPKATAARRFVESLGDLRRTVARALHSRAELFTLEVARERALIVRTLAFAIGALFFITLAAFAFTFFVIVLFWDTHRAIAAGLITLAYVVIAAGLGFAAKRQLTRAERPFAHTLDQLRKDRDQVLSR